MSEILTVEQVALYRPRSVASITENMLRALCDSHEALRADNVQLKEALTGLRDEIRARARETGHFVADLNKANAALRGEEGKPK